MISLDNLDFMDFVSQTTYVQMSNNQALFGRHSVKPVILSL